jgi:hypothetical protein
MITRRLIYPILFALTPLATAMAQDKAPQPRSSPLEAVTQPKAETPVTVAAPTKPIDPDIDAVARLLAGSFVSEAEGQTPGLHFNAAPIAVEGLDNAVYFEVGRADSPADPFRQGVFHAYRFKGELRLRVFDFSGNAGLKDTLVGLWAAPESLPKLTLGSLDPNLDLVLTDASGRSAFRGQTAHPYPTMRDGAVEMTARIGLSANELSFGDHGVGADGETAWGAPTPVTFKRVQPAVTVNHTEGGLTILTLIPPASPDAPKLVENGTVTVQYSGWLTDGTRFDTSRMPGRQPFSTRLPGGVIRGWNEGLKGIAKGERRRLVIPAEMGYGARGFQRVIPPNATLIFDVECVHVDNTVPPEIAQPPGGAPAGATPTGAPPAPGTPPGGAKPR